MPTLSAHQSQAHQTALQSAKNFKAAHVELLRAIEAVDSQRVVQALGYASLWQYCQMALGLSEGVIACLITVARKVREIPELRVAIEEKGLSPFQAKKIAAVVTRDNATEWIEAALTQTSREIERSVAEANPQAAPPVQIKPIGNRKAVLTVTLPEEVLLLLREMEHEEGATTEQTLVRIIREYHKRRHPSERAKRQVLRKGVQVKERATYRNPAAKGAKTYKDRARGEAKKESARQRTPIPAAHLHQVYLRDGRRCAHKLPDGTRCSSRRFLHIHHKTPVSRGGTHHADNLITLCAGHHRIVHERIVQEGIQAGKIHEGMHGGTHGMIQAETHIGWRGITRGNHTRESLTR